MCPPVAPVAPGSVTDMIVDSQDNIYLTSSTRVRKIEPSGIIDRVTGGGTLAPASGVLAIDALFSYSGCSLSLALDNQDQLYVGCARFPSQIYRIENGYLELIAGVDDVDSIFPGPRMAASRWQLISVFRRVSQF